jgi:uncharacterized membrane protein HdeD (DUF308 family)
MSTISVETYGVVTEDEPDGGPPFWALLTIGILWILLSFIILQFTYSSILSISILMGIVLILAAASETGMAFIAAGWKWAHVALAVLFFLGSIFAWVYPGQTFGTLALIFGWYLLIKGTFDVVISLTNHGAHLWWLGLLAGIAEMAIAFWAVGYVGRSAALLVLWVGIGALLRGIMTLVWAFQVRHAARGAV